MPPPLNLDLGRRILVVVFSAHFTLRRPTCEIKDLVIEHFPAPKNSRLKPKFCFQWEDGRWQLNHGQSVQLFDTLIGLTLYVPVVQISANSIRIAALHLFTLLTIHKCPAAKSAKYRLY